MTPPADLRGNLETRPSGRIIGVRCVVSCGAMAILALNAFELRRGSGTDESTRRPETNRMASQAARVRVLMNLLKRGKGLGVQRTHHGVVNRLMAFDARSGSHKVGGRTQDTKQRIGAGAGNKRTANEIGARTDGLPDRVTQAPFFKELVIA